MLLSLRWFAHYYSQCTGCNVIAIVPSTLMLSEEASRDVIVLSRHSNLSATVTMLLRVTRDPSLKP